jgi:hypothetical protein
MILKWTLTILAVLCLFKIILGVWACVMLWPLPPSIHIWSDFILWFIVFAILAFFLFRHYKIAMVFVLFFSLQELWDFRDMGGSPLLLFTMGIQAQLETIELLLASLLSIIGISIWIYQTIKKRNVSVQK